MYTSVRAGLLLLLLPALVPAQPGPDGPRFTLPSDSRPGQVLEAIREHLPEANWERLARALQSVLDRGDTLTTGPGGKRTSARAEAVRLFGEFPAAGQAVYRLLYDPVAQDLLRVAKQEGDPQRLLDLLARYELTTPATEALELLGTQLARQGRDAEAAATFARLRERVPLEKWPAERVYLAARAATRTGSPLAQEVTRHLTALGEVTVEGKKLTPAEIATALKGWRSVSDPGGPLPLPTWGRKPALAPDHAKLLNDAAAALVQRGEMVPAVARPELVRATIDGKDRSALIVRTFEGVQCLDVASGAILWQVPLRDDLAAALRDPLRGPLFRSWATSYPPPSTVLFDNTRTGLLTVGAGQVFVVEDVPFLLRPSPFPLPGGPATPAALKESLGRNRLTSFSIATGKLLWEAGGKEPELADGWFLGAPLVLGEGVLALHERNRELRLVRLAAQTGKVLEVRPLGNLGQSLSEGADRRRGVQLTHAGGHLLVPTGCGSLLALDLPTLRPAWLYEYDDAADPVPVRPFPGNQPAKVRPGYTFAALALGDLVVATGPDATRVHALDRATGARRWAVALQDGDRVVGPLTPAGLLVLGKESLRLLNSTTGDTLWRITLTQPLGQGYLSGGRYYQPVAGAILAIDLQRGRLAARIRVPDLVPPGNLVPAGDVVVAIGPNGLAVLPQLESERGKLEKEANNPDGHAARLRLAELEQQLGRTADALANTRKALAGKLDGDGVAQGRDLLFRLLGELARTAPEEFAQQRDEYRKLADVQVPADAPGDVQKRLRELRTERLSVALPLLAEGHLHAKEYRKAVELALDLVTLEGPDALVDGPTAGQRLTRAARAAGIVRAALAGGQEAALGPIAERSRAMTKPDGVAEVRKMLDAVPIGTAGDDFHLRFARVLAEKDAAGAERLLARLASDGSPRTRVQAHYARYRLAVQVGRLADAVALARDLAARYGTEVVTVANEPRQTGKEVLATLATDRRFVPLLAEPPAIPRKWTATEEKQAAPATAYRPAFAPRTPGLPSEPARLIVDVAGGPQVRILDPNEKVLGTVNLGPALRFQAEVQGLALAQQAIRSTRAGRVLLLPLGEFLVAVDPLAGVLWTRNRLDQEARGGFLVVAPAVNQRLGWYPVRFSEGWTALHGAPVAALGNFVATTTSQGVEGLDSETGQVVWQRRDLAAPGVLLVVAGKLLFVEYDGTAVKATTWLRAEDGGAATGSDLASAFADAVHLHEGQLVSLTTGEARVLRAVDLATGRETWRKDVPAESVLVESKVPGVVGWVEPTGTVRLLDATTGGAVVTQTLEKELRNLAEVVLLADGKNLYLATQPKNALTGQPTQSGIQSAVPVQGALVTGHVIAFDRATQKLAWYFEAEGVYLAVPHGADVPVVLLGSLRPGARARTDLTLLDRRTGKLLHEQKVAGYEPCVGLRWQPDKATLEVIGATRRIQLVGE